MSGPARFLLHHKRMVRGIAAVFALLIAPLAARADDMPSVVVSTGQLGMRKEIPHSLAIDVQLRPGWHWSVVRPVAGVLTSSHGGAYVYSGIAADFPLGDWLVISPGFAPGVVAAKGDRELGYPIEFRSSIELSAAIRPMQLALSFSHISNARLGDHNPGVEVLTLGVSFPAARR